MIAKDPVVCEQGMFRDHEKGSVVHHGHGTRRQMQHAVTYGPEDHGANHATPTAPDDEEPCSVSRSGQGVDRVLTYDA